MSSSPDQAKLEVHDTSVLSRTVTKHINSSIIDVGLLTTVIRLLTCTERFLFPKTKFPPSKSSFRYKIALKHHRQLHVKFCPKPGFNPRLDMCKTVSRTIHSTLLLATTVLCMIPCGKNTKHAQIDQNYLVCCIPLGRHQSTSDVAKHQVRHMGHLVWWS